MRGARKVLLGMAVVVAFGPVHHVPPVSVADPAPLPAPAPASTTTTTTLAPPVATTLPPPAAGSPARVVGAVCVPDPMPAVPPETDLASTNGAAVGYAAAPGGGIVGHLPASSWGGPTVRPVVGSAPGWLEVRLDTRPNGSTGWVPLRDVTAAATGYALVISTCHRTLTVFQGGQPIYSAAVGVGRSVSPTPLGPSFVDAFVRTPRSLLGTYGPMVVITGSHSNVYTEFDGGNGTVAIHEYPSDPASTRGVGSSHGCVRIGPPTLQAVENVPVGTPIDIIN